MLAFAGMLVSAAKAAKIKVPKDPERWEEEKDKYPYFFMYCACQLGAAMPYPGCHYDNAKVIANIPKKDLKLITLSEIIERGFHIST